MGVVQICITVFLGQYKGGVVLGVCSGNVISGRSTVALLHSG